MSLLKWLRLPVIYIRKEAALPRRLCYNEPNPESVQTEEEVNEPVISVEKSIKYLKSKAFKEGYGNDPVWFHYRRNFKGHIPPETRRDCLPNGKLNNASPCPICRDKYLVVDYRNVDLISQFIEPISGLILPSKKTGVCQKQHYNLKVAIAKAKNYGLIKSDYPHRHYDYSLYYENYKK